MRRSLAGNLAICLVLMLAGIAVYAPMRHFGLLNFDDPEFVGDNPHLRAGLTGESLAWAFTSTESANWFPLTRLSYLLDAQMWGTRRGPQHLTSVLLHVFAAICLFAFLDLATGNRRLSALAAFLFALHPLHVESVAWISERKDVLCGLFWFLTLWAYVRYQQRPGVGRYAAALLAFAAGLMAKPMIITLPVVLLLLDIWPLRRRVTVREKLPFFALSAVAAVTTYLVQEHSGAVGAFANYPPGLRLENALVSYVVYLGKMWWPSGLAVFYPYPREIPAWHAGPAALGLTTVSFFALRSRSSRPYLAAGWLWYVVTLLPVIGLVQVGAQARADRYLYVPMVGLAIVLVWGADDLLRGAPRVRPAGAVAAVIACLLCAVTAAAQVEHWRDSESLFRHALAVTRENYLAHNNLGAALAGQPGRLAEAIDHYQAALRIWPDYPDAHNNLGSALAQTPGGLPRAIAEFEAALRERPEFAEAHFNLANTLAQIRGREADAIAQYREALRIRPDYLAAHINLGAVLLRTPGRLPDAIAEYRTALQLDPRSAEAHNNLGSALALTSGGLREAIAEFQAALADDPGYARAHYNLANVLAGIPGRRPEAIAEYQACLRADPAYADAHYNLAVTLGEAGRTQEAVAEYEAALRLQPDSARAHYNLGVILLKLGGRLPEALTHLETALRIAPNPDVQRLVDRLRVSAGR